MALAVLIPAFLHSNPAFPQYRRPKNAAHRFLQQAVSPDHERGSRAQLQYPGQLPDSRSEVTFLGNPFSERQVEEPVRVGQLIHRCGLEMGPASKREIPGKVLDGFYLGNRTVKAVYVGAGQRKSHCLDSDAAYQYPLASKGTQEAERGLMHDLLRCTACGNDLRTGSSRNQARRSGIAIEAGHGGGGEPADAVPFLGDEDDP